jgi:DGQHR domain-containing protein
MTHRSLHVFHHAQSEYAAMRILRLPAIEIKQGPNRRLYSFAVDGKRLFEFAAVSRLRRDDGTALSGYQRPEVVSHIGEIRRYLESDSPLLPNAIVVAFDRRVRFEPSDIQPVRPRYARVGTLIIPKIGRSDALPGWIVDGQQRSAAIREADIGSFPISVTAFITDDDHEQKEQFILVNSTKPLPKGLIYELLPTTRTRLPRRLQKRRFPSYLLERLNYDVDSPFRELIQTPTNPTGVVKDNSILKMLENSLDEGALHPFRDAATGQGDRDSMLTMLKTYWTSVKETFGHAWGLMPRKSRLMHGAGIASMGFIMDAIADPYVPDAIPSKSHFLKDLAMIAPLCRWTEGEWEFGPDRRRRWNDLQNTPADIQMLTSYLLRAHGRAVRVGAESRLHSR